MTGGLEAWLRLVLAPEIGPVLAHRLLAAFGSPEAVFSSTPRALGAVPGMGPRRLERLLDAAPARAAREELARCEAAGVTLIPFGNHAYPHLLGHVASPPLLLWVKGELLPGDRLALAIVGPRRPSGYARLMADRLAPALAAAGLTLVSGLAYGVDAAVHRAEVDAGGRTIGVLGQGLGAAVYPPANAELAAKIIDGHGALVSVFPMTAEPSQGLFPARNEIIAALSLATLVVEASSSSGSLITARHAAALGRTVMACPGDATRMSARGSNRLLGEGAVLVQAPEDALESLAPELRRAMAELGINAPAAAPVDGIDPDDAQPDLFSQVPAAPWKPEPLAFADPLDSAILQALGEEPLPIDAIMEKIEEAGLPPARVNQRLLELELSGHLKQLPGRIYAPARS